MTQLPPISSLVTRQLSFEKEISAERVFSQLAQQKWAVWLDSGESSHQDSRFHIIAWQPKVVIETCVNKTNVYGRLNEQQSLIESSEQDPLAIVEKYHQQLFANTQLSTDDIPFKGGCIGLFNYELGKRFEQLPSQAECDIDMPEMSVGIYDQALIFDQDQQTFTLVANEENIAKIAQQIEQSVEEQKPQFNFALTSAWQSNMSESAYREKFAQVQQYLLSGDCYQINLAQRFSATYQGDAFAAYQALRQHNKAPFSAFMHLPNASIVSISPERFLKLTDDTVETKPIKGTRPRGATPELDQQLADDLKSAPKDRAENLMIVDLLRNDISKVCKAGTVKVPEIFAIESFPAVHHLVSTVVGEIKDDKNAFDLLRGAFPGGSITGAPKIRAMEIIDELEPHQRSAYCGSIAYISACGNMDASITIRTLVCHNQHIHCWAGGGLVADSVASEEYQETYDKVAKILPILDKT